MSSNTEDETLRKAERLISEYRNTTSTRDKINSIYAFNSLWESAGSETNYAGMLRGMRHVGLLPPIMESITSRDRVTMDTVELQCVMLIELQKFFRCCSMETPNPGPVLFKQFEASVPEVFVRSFEMIEEKIQEQYIIRLQINLLRTFVVVSEFFLNVDVKPQIIIVSSIQHIDVSKLLDTLWGTCFAPMPPSPDASSARNSLFLGNYPLIAIALDDAVPSWDKVYRPASLTRAIAQYGPERIAHRIKEVCEDSQTPTKAFHIRTVGEIISVFADNQAVEVEIIKAGLPKGLIRAYWTWLRKTDNKGEEPEADLPKMILQVIYLLLLSLSKTAGHKTLLKKIVQDVLDEDFMMIVGKALVVTQYEKNFVKTAVSMETLPL
ncbi:hypothetical protein FRC04_003316 [Tulasnella sp. 424]|nr:hypothetical protein FRC04_003316 [Tulasnella sp. 424]